MLQTKTNVKERIIGARGEKSNMTNSNSGDHLERIELTLERASK